MCEKYYDLCKILSHKDGIWLVFSFSSFQPEAMFLSRRRGLLQADKEGKRTFEIWIWNLAPPFFYFSFKNSPTTFSTSFFPGWDSNPRPQGNSPGHFTNYQLGHQTSWWENTKKYRIYVSNVKFRLIMKLISLSWGKLF